jgi:hypothetical protein
MNAYKAIYSNGTVKLLEQPPKQSSTKEQDVVVLFLDEANKENDNRTVSAKDLLQLSGIVSFGGDAAKDKKALYDR